jgi:hypothetical protein
MDEEVTIAYGASNDYATHKPLTTAVEGHYTKEAVNQIHPTSAPRTTLTMEGMPIVGDSHKGSLITGETPFFEK